MATRRGGTIFFKKNGKPFDAKGAFTYNLGKAKREGIIGADGVHGYKETPQLAYIEGEITDSADLDLEADLLEAVNETVTLELANGKIIVLDNAYFAGDGNGETEEGAITIRFESESGREVN